MSTIAQWMVMSSEWVIAVRIVKKLVVRLDFIPHRWRHQTDGTVRHLAPLTLTAANVRDHTIFSMALGTGLHGSTSCSGRTSTQT